MSGTRDDEKRVPDPESPSVNGEEEGHADVDFEPDEELGDIGAANAKMSKLREELAAIKKERQEYLDGWQRCKADSVNARKDAEKIFDRSLNAARERVVENMLPVLDSFDMAIGGEAWQNVDATWRTGVESIRSQLLRALELSGVTPFGSVGDNYDPFLHEILQESAEGGSPGTIARVVRRGWRLGERVIRPAHVVIHKIEQ